MSINAFSQPWVPDLGNGNYKNPIIYADYSDPDIIRVEEDFYMVASSFNCMPGIPILHSKDLVNWKIINHVYDSLPLQRYDKPQHGEGSWAPSIRYNDNKFYVYFCTPQDGLFMASTDDPKNNWDLIQVEKVELWEDPCPFWDGNGDAYLVRSKVCAGEIYIHKMSFDGKKLLDNEVLVYKDVTQPTIEGPKLFKKDGYYYILAPAGGVPTGWQTVLRSKNIFGPYEAKIVLHQGNTNINGPHQGGLVELESGEWWFVHFQSKKPYGRIVHLQPVTWNDGWLLIGIDINDDGIGEPVTEYKKPTINKNQEITIPQTNDEFNENELGLQWQWHANPKSSWYSMKDNSGSLRLFAVKNISKYGNLWFVPNLLLQKFPSPSFTATTKIKFNGQLEGESSGLVIMGEEWCYLGLVKTDTGMSIKLIEGKMERCFNVTNIIESIPYNNDECYFRVTVNENGECIFNYSLDNEKYYKIRYEFQATEGRWIGAKVGLFCINPNISVSNGYADFDWFRIE